MTLACTEEKKTVKVIPPFQKILRSTVFFHARKISFQQYTLPPSHAQIPRGKDRVLRENPRFLSGKRLFPEVGRVKVFDSTVAPFLAFEFRESSLSPPLFCVGSSGLSMDPEKD
jgi:hypothetical protein